MTNLPENYARVLFDLNIGSEQVQEARELLVESDELMEALKSAKGFIRRSLGKRMIIRYSPELIFISDKNIEYGVHIAKVLADTIKPEKNADEGVQDGSDAEES